MSREAPQSFENRERISVNNIVRRVVSAETGEAHFVLTMRRRKESDGRTFFVPIGGGAKLTPRAIRLLKKSLNAAFKDELEEGNDARYTIPVPKDQPENFFKRLARFHAKPHPRHVEDSVQREFLEEVRESLENTGHHVPEGVEGALKDEMVYIRILHPKKGEETTSARGPAHRVFRYFDVTTPQALIDEMKKSKELLFLNEADVERAREAQSRGENSTPLSESVSIITEHLEVS